MTNKENKNLSVRNDLLIWIFIILIFLYHYGLVPESFIIQFIIYITGIGPLFLFDKWYSKYYDPLGDPFYNVVTMILIILGPALFWSWVGYRVKPILEKLRKIFT